MGKYSNILLCSDLDGTLITHAGIMPEKNLRAIEYFCSEGGKFCMSTGRLPDHLLNYFDKATLANCPIICCNGACIYDYNTDKILYEKPLSSHTSELADFIFENCQNIIHTTIFTKGPDKHDFESYAGCINEIRSMLAVPPVYKIVLVFDTEEHALNLKKKLEKNFGEHFNIARSWPIGLEVLDKNATKGDTVHVLKNILGDGRTSVCVGDYENDITMIQKADIGCAVANAVDVLKAVADKIVCSNGDGAIDYIVKNVLNWI